ncbi:MAG: hypothetical protein QXY49_03090 [Thermofilaceae archaeon]
MIAVDTDVLAIYFIFKWDPRFEVAKTVIDSENVKAITIVNALELMGLMSIAESGAKARELFSLLHRRRDFHVLYWRTWLEQQVFVSKVLEYVSSRRSPFTDALIGWILEENGIELLVTWNTRHFVSRYSFETITPEQYLGLTPPLSDN